MAPDALEKVPGSQLIGAVAPCGACRQVLAEFAPNLKLFLISPEAPEIQQRYDLQELLPASFSGSEIKPAL